MNRDWCDTVVCLNVPLTVCVDVLCAWLGFKQLVIEDQVTLVREAVYPITLLFHSQFYNPGASLQR